MKELKPGDLVWHKEHGRGIVRFSKPSFPSILFEANKTAHHYPRKELFTRGDHVLFNKYASHPFKHFVKEVGTFYDAITHNPKAQSKYTIMYNGSVRYAKEIVHSNEHASEWTCHISSSGRFTSNCANFQEIPKEDAWGMFRKEATAYARFKSNLDALEKEHERIEHGKQLMLQDLHLTTLEATAKEMLKEIKEIRDEL